MKLNLECKNCGYEKEIITRIKSIVCDKCKAHLVPVAKSQEKKVSHKHKKHHRSTKPLTSRPFEELLKKTK